MPGAYRRAIRLHFFRRQPFSGHGCGCSAFANVTKASNSPCVGHSKSYFGMYDLYALGVVTPLFRPCSWLKFRYTVLWPDTLGLEEHVLPSMLLKRPAFNPELIMTGAVLTALVHRMANIQLLTQEPHSEQPQHGHSQLCPSQSRTEGWCSGWSDQASSARCAGLPCVATAMSRTNDATCAVAPTPGDQAHRGSGRR